MYRIVFLSVVFAVAPSSAFGQVRTWRDATGKFSIEAEFVEFQDGKVRLRKSDGKTVSIAKDQLSKQDQAYVDTRQKTAGKGAKDAKWRRDYRRKSSGGGKECAAGSDTVRVGRSGLKLRARRNYLRSSYV